MTTNFAGLWPLAAAIMAFPARAAEPHEPVGKWVLDYGETLCSASRTYGTGAKPIRLGIIPSPSGKMYRIVVQKHGKVYNPYHFPVTASFSSTEAKTTALRFASGDRKWDVVWLNVPHDKIEGLGTATKFGIRGEGEMNQHFALPGIGAVLKALDKCNADLRNYWNVDATVATAPAQPAIARTSLRDLISEKDFPRQALREGKGGTTGFLLMIDEQGTTKGCMVEETSGIASLDAMACGVLLERAKFSPALDKAGKPMRSVCYNRITWAIAS